jgi:outer membrane PBP1 activator LpoA protein
MRASRTAVALAAVALALVLAACGKDAGGPVSKYPKAAEQQFLKECKRTSGRADACSCALEKLEQTVSYAEFKKADAAIRAGGKASGDTAKKISEATTSCA